MKKHIPILFNAPKNSALSIAARNNLPFAFEQEIKWPDGRNKSLGTVPAEYKFILNKLAKRNEIRFVEEI
jgi:hypothetical protein